ncbi:MAG: ATPase P [Thermoleophilia bacterium]
MPRRESPPPGIAIDLPEPLHLGHLVLDLNGTLAGDGALQPGLETRLAAIGRLLDVLLVSGDTFGTAATIAERLRIRRLPLAPVDQAEAKRAVVESLGPGGTVVIGNGRNDALALERAALGICVMGAEGAASQALQAADVVVQTPHLALDLLLHPTRLVATLRR